MSTVIPLMPEASALPEEFQVLNARQQAFAWNYVFNGANGAQAARDAGFSDVAEGAKVRAHGMLQRDDVSEAIRALTTKYLFSLAPMAVLRLKELLENPKHPKHAKAIEMTLDRAGQSARTAIDVNVSGSVQVNHTDAAVEDLARLLALGVSRERLVETFGFSGLPRLERMLADRRRREVRQIEGEVVDGNAN